MPKSIESFYQEAGRAGRYKDKTTQSCCYILNKPETVPPKTIEKIFDKKTGVAELKKLLKRLKSDLGTVLYLLNLNRVPPEEECDKVLKILAELGSVDSEGDRKILEFDDATIPLSFDKGKEIFQRLERIGAAKSWREDEPVISDVLTDKQRLEKIHFDDKRMEDVLKKLSKGQRTFSFVENFSLEATKNISDSRRKSPTNFGRGF